MSEVGGNYGVGGCVGLSGWRTAENKNDRDRRAVSQRRGIDMSGETGNKAFDRHIRRLNEADRTNTDRINAGKADADRRSGDRAGADGVSAENVWAEKPNPGGACTGGVYAHKADGDGRCNPGRDMTLEEYTQYINGRISELDRSNYSRGNSVFIYISKEGFQAMYEDPEYEAWVMENIRSAYGFCRSRGGHDGYHSAHFFGATKEEYRGQSWQFGCSKCEQERRRELKLRRKKQLKALLKKRQERKWQEKQRLQKLRLDKIHLEKRLLEKDSRRKILVKRWKARDAEAEEFREEALARREAESARRMYEAMLHYSQ